MSKGVLNAIIIFSSVGIVLVGLSDFFIKKPLSQANKNALVTPTITQSILPTGYNDRIPCVNKFYSFKKGNTWEYEITKKGQKKADILLSTITENSTGSAVLTHTLNDRHAGKTTITCRSSGIHGEFFPIKILIHLDNENNFVSSLIKENWRKISFLPSELNSDSWTTEIPINIPFGLLDKNQTTVVMNHHVDGNEIFNFKNNVYKTKKITLTVDDSKLPIKLKEIGLTDSSIMKYTIAEGIGIIDLTMMSPGNTSSTTKLHLKNFQEKND